MSADAGIQELGGKFRVLAELGQGGSANVWLTVARGPSGFSKLVVLKSMKAELKREPELAQMFLNEANLAARLSHPNIVQTNEVFEHDGVPIIVMEYLDGQSLAAVLGRHRQGGGFPLPLQLRVLSETLGGLHAAHELTDFDGTRLEVVHRDVSPHNILVTYDGQAKVIDFGIAKLSSLGETSESGVIRGKLHYMSPEQVNGGTVDRRADIYSAGVLLWEMAAGVRMWKGVNEAVVMNRVLSGQLPPLRAVNPSVPRRIEEIVHVATALEPDDRYPTAADYQLDVDEFLAATAPQLRTRDVGEAVARIFGDLRAERRQIVERELARVAEQTPDEYGRRRPVLLPALELHAEQATQMLRKRRREAIYRALPWGVVAILGITLIVLLQRLGPRPDTGPDASIGGPGASVSQVVPIRLRVTAFPAEAELSLDGQPLIGNPHLGAFPRDDSHPRTLTASAKGHVTLKRVLLLDRDQDLVLTLQKAEEQDGTPTAETESKEPQQGRPLHPRLPAEAPQAAPGSEPPAPTRASAKQTSPRLPPSTWSKPPESVLPEAKPREPEVPDSGPSPAAD